MRRPPLGKWTLRLGRDQSGTPSRSGCRPCWRNRCDGQAVKQRLTATRLHELLLTEGHQVGVTMVKEAVAEWKRQRREVFVPLTYRPGDSAEVDFFEAPVDVDGTRREAWPFDAPTVWAATSRGFTSGRINQLSRRACPRVCTLRRGTGFSRGTTISGQLSSVSSSAAHAR